MLYDLATSVTSVSYNNLFRPSSVLAKLKCVKVGEGTYGEVYKMNDGVEDAALKV